MTKVSLIEAATADGFGEPALAERLRVCSRSSKTVSYRADLDGEERAFVALDRWPEIGCMVLYELFVLRRFRAQGTGSEVLAAVEERAASERFATVRVVPRALDDTTSDAWLDGWYSRRGYLPVSNGGGELEKNVCPETSD